MCLHSQVFLCFVFVVGCDDADDVIVMVVVVVNFVQYFLAWRAISDILFFVLCVSHWQKYGLILWLQPHNVCESFVRSESSINRVYVCTDYGHRIHTHTNDRHTSTIIHIHISMSLSFFSSTFNPSIYTHTYIHSVCVCITHTHKHWTLIHVHYPLLCSSISIRSCWLMAKSSSSSISSSTSELPRKKSHSLNVRLSLSVRTVYIFIYLYIHTHSLTQLPAARAFNTHIYVCSMVHGSLPLFPVVVFWPSWTLDLATPVAYVCLA